MKEEFFDNSIQKELLKKADKIINVHIPNEYLQQICKEGKFKEFSETILNLTNKAWEENDYECKV